MPAKNHLKIPSAFVVCCNFLLILFNKAKYRDKQCGPESTLFVGKAPKTFQKKLNFVVIGALSINVVLRIVVLLGCFTNTISS